MARSLYGGPEEYIMNHYRYRKLGDGYLLTNDYGAWAHVTADEFKQIKQHKLGNHAHGILKEKGLVLDHENVERVIREYRQKMGYLFQGVSLHIVVPTLRCNIRCVYCHAKAQSANAKGYDMDEMTAKKTLDFIFQSPSSAYNIEFQGGEPLLRPDLVKFMINYGHELNKKHKKNLKFSVVTNMTLMTDDMFEFLKKRKVGLCTSLDGCKAVHNKNRQEYDKVAGWIRKITKTTTLHAMLLATKYTLPKYKEIVDEYIELGLPRIWIKPVNKLAYAQGNWEKIGMTAEEYLKFWRRVIDYIVLRNRDVFIGEEYTRILLRKILTKECINFTDLESPCGAAIVQLAYSYDGSIYTCDEGRLYDIFKLGTVDDRYSDIVTSESACAIVKASINDNPVCEVCAYKPYCGLCPVCSFADTGNIISKLPDRRCRILIGMFDYIFEKLLFDDEYKKVFLSWLPMEKYIKEKT